MRNLGTTTDVQTAGAVHGIGRTKAYELAGAGEFSFAVIRARSRCRVPVPVLVVVLGAGWD